MNEIKHEALAEKIYLQLNGEVFTFDEILWFKAILANATTHNLQISSGVLNVDLINDNNEIVDSKLVKVKNGIGEGSFDIDRSLNEGFYKVRAYTQWNKNFANNFITHKNIQILTKKPTSIYPKQSLSNDTLVPRLDMQFFPEGGKIIEGISLKVGFKITDFKGAGVKVSGEVYDEKKEIIAKFQSNDVGLGFFIIQNPDANKGYKARIIDSKNTMLYNLPKVHKKGYTLSVIDRKNIILVSIKTNINASQNLYLSGALRGKNYFKQKSKLLDGGYIFTIPKSSFPNGVIVFLLSDENDKPISERLFFNYLENRNFDIEISNRDSVIEPRQSVKMDLKINSKEFKEKASASILVLKKELYKEFLKDRDNILSFFLISSDIKGKIEKPGRYFDESNKLEVDKLMLTQGWRNYKYISKRKNLNFKLEKNLSIKGVINVKNAKQKDSILNVALATFGDDSSYYTGTIKVPGSFDFKIEDLFGDQKQFIIKPLGLNDKQLKNYNISVYKRNSLKPNFSNNTFLISTLKRPKTIEILKSKFEKSEKLNKYYTKLNGVTELKEVVLNTYKMTPKRAEVYQKYGKPDVVINGNEIKKSTNKYSRGLYSNLLGFNNKVTIIKDSIGNYLAQTLNGGKDHKNLVIVDGVPVNPNSYNLIQKIAPDEVTSFEIIDNPPGIRALYAQVYNSPVPSGDFTGSIISIYTKNEKGLFGALKSKKEDGVFSIQGFSIEKEFYIPKHDSSTQSDNFNSEPDLRSTIYWNPSLSLESSNKTHVTYSHSDDIGDFLVLVEAITTNGNIGYNISEYKVSSK